MDLTRAKKIKDKCTVAAITSNWTKMTDRHLPPAGQGTQFMSANLQDVVPLIAKAIRAGGSGGGGPLTACDAYADPDDPSKVIIVGTFPGQVGQTNPGGAACNHIKVVLGEDGGGKVIFYSAYPVQNLPAGAALGAITN